MSVSRAATPAMGRRIFVRHCSLIAGAACVPAWAAPTAAPVILVVGDSLSAEYGLARGAGWVALLQARLGKSQPAARVVNASISGDTTAGGRARLPALLETHRPTHVIVELGGNDALRGLPLKSTREHLEAMVRSAQGAGAAVLLVGMQVPPNYGRSYTQDFSALFAQVAQSTRCALVPFLLQGIAEPAVADRYFQADRIHPNEAAQEHLLQTVWPHLQRLLGSKG